jgi:rhomboid protease GluP
MSDVKIPPVLRQKHGSVVCPGCRNLVGVRDERCMTCGRSNPGLWGFGPVLARFGRDFGFTPFVIATCVALFAATLLFFRSRIGMSGLSFLSPANESLFVFGASGAFPVFRYGRWWTVLTAGWLHGGILHIVFNMMSLRNLAPLTADLYGSSRMAIIFIVSGVAGFTASSVVGQYGDFLAWIPLLGRLLRGGQFTIGASAGIAGMIGAILYYGGRAGNRAAADQAKQWIIWMLLMGFLLPQIDNWAHLGGLAGGYLCSKILDPLHPERMDHFLIALGLLAATAAAFAASIIYGLQAL